MLFNLFQIASTYQYPVEIYDGKNSFKENPLPTCIQRRSIADKYVCNISNCVLVDVKAIIISVDNSG